MPSSMFQPSVTGTAAMPRSASSFTTASAGVSGGTAITLRVMVSLTFMAWLYLSIQSGTLL
jgi:hypothetical protein